MSSILNCFVSRLNNFSVKFFGVLVLFFWMNVSGTWGQSYLGLDGGFEGAATIDNSTINSTAQANKWTKANVSQTIAIETLTVRSGGNSLSINNSDDTGKRVWSPIFSVSTQTTEVTIQYYRYVTDATNSQSNQEAILKDANESQQGTYNTPSAGAWEKQTYNPASSTFSAIAGFLMHKQIGTGGNMYIDDMCIYAGAVDNIAPSVPTAFTTVSVTSNSINLSWSAPLTGVDNGGYLVVRGTVDPTTAPNVNGIYAVGNSIGSGVVVYQGTGTGFTDNGLTEGTNYYYRIYTYDKAYNYSSALVGSQATAAIPATTATAATSISSTGFIANWDAGVGASGYRLDVVKTFGGVLLNQGFENTTFPPTDWLSTNFSRGTVTGEFVNGIAGAICGSFNGFLTTNSVAYPTSLKFYLGRTNSTASKTLKVNVSTSNQISGFTTIATFDHSNVTESSYNQYIVDLSAYTNYANVYIQFEKASSTTAAWRIDDIVVEKSPVFLSGHNNLEIPSGISQTINGLSPNTNYFYRVRSTSANSTSENSNVISVTTSQVSTPTAIAASNVTSTGIRLNLNTVVDATAYVFDLSTDEAFSSFVFTYNGFPVTGGAFQNISGLIPSTTYYYRVRATSPNSTSANSNVITVTTLARYTIGLSASSNGSITSGAGNYDAGLSVTVVATPISGYRFESWTENGSPVSTLASYTFTAAGNRTLVANFASNTVGISSGTINASNLVNCVNCDVTVSNGAELTVNETKVFNSVTVAPGGKLTLSNGSNLTSPITLQSSTDGTATFIDRNTGAPQTISASVNQLLSATRNWYISSPVSAATSPSTNITRYYEYIEPGNNEALSVAGSTLFWKGYNVAHSMAVGKGYIAQTSASTTINFNGYLNNNIEYPITVSRTGSAARAGFNLIGNPYMGYLDWKQVIDDLDNKDVIETSKWYRTYNTSNTYTFSTHNGTSGQTVTGTANTDITKFIPPMQAFWVRVKSNLTGEQTIKLKKSMLEHRDTPDNKFKAPANDNQSIIRLQVSNGINTDEALIYFNSNASNTYDDFDSYKMFNNSNSLPELYTLADGEKLVINGLRSVADVTELPIGFATLQANDFSIIATEIKNFDSNIQILLKDKLSNAEFDLTSGKAYEFSSAAVDDANRFSIIFRTSGSANGIGSTKLDNSTSVFFNANGDLIVNTVAPLKSGAHVSVYNAIGQQISTQSIKSAVTIIKAARSAGIYWISIRTAGDVVTRKVVLK